MLRLLVVSGVDPRSSSCGVVVGDSPLHQGEVPLFEADDTELDKRRREAEKLSNWGICPFTVPRWLLAR